MSRTGIFLIVMILFCIISNADYLSFEGVDNSNDFAADLFRILGRNKGNLFISPYSISSALYMTYAGARGNTAEQMKDLLNINLGPQDKDLHSNMKKIAGSLERLGISEGIELNIANSLWPQESYAFYNEYISLLGEFYSVSIFPVNYRDTEKARSGINQWVSEKTNNKISNMIPPGVLTPLTVMVLVNAVYFKATWQNEFDRDKTGEDDFFIKPDKKIRVNMMNRTDKYSYGELGNCQVLELPYADREISMFIILPQAGNSIETAAEAISAGYIKKIRQELAKYRVDVSLPRFRLSYAAGLTQVLQSMGMTDACDMGKADFTGMYDKQKAGGDNLYISDIRHKAFVEVNEEGTEAAAATSVTVARTSFQPPLEQKVFKADHPFIFMIVDNKTGAVLFIGRIENPDIQECSYEDN